MASGAEASEPLKYQTWVLKVSIHCEGCKKKVKKVLQGIDGVYKVTVDSQQQKVTVTGNVDADLLVKKLCRAGKHAKLWPEKNPTSPNPTSSSATCAKKNTKKSDANPSLPSGSPEKSSEEYDGSASDKSVAVEVPKKPNEMSAVALSPVAGDEGGKSTPAVAAKRKAKSTPANPGSPSGCEKETTDINGRQGVPLFQLPSPAYPSPLPAYVLSFNTAQPASSYGCAAYHPTAMQQSSYLYSGHFPLMGGCYIPAMAAPPTGCYDMFAEEKANGCCIM